jgi:hypothetical protein
MKEHGMNNTLQVWQYFEDSFHNIAKSISKTVVTWQDPFSSGLSQSKDTLVQVWIYDTTTLQAVKKKMNFDSISI